MNYFPDNWVIVAFTGDNPHYRVLVGWSGSYINGDSWRMNSGITRVEESDHHFSFYGASGSCYVCHKESYGLRRNNFYVWDQLIELHGDAVALLDSETDWTKMDWILK